MRVPTGYLVDETDGVLSIARPTAQKFIGDALQTHGTLYAFATAHKMRTLQGRTEAYVIETPEGPWVVRHYVRGGAVASMLGDRYVRVGARRPFAELWTSAVARARGIETPAVAAVAIYAHGPFYRGDIATDLVPDAADLATLSVGPDRRAKPERLLAWRAAGRLVRAIAEAGLIHADLNLRNILISWQAGLPHAHLLDLDRCRIVRRVRPSNFNAMVQRLIRSAARFEQKNGDALVSELDAFRDGLRA